MKIVRIILLGMFCVGNIFAIVLPEAERMASRSLKRFDDKIFFANPCETGNEALGIVGNVEEWLFKQKGRMLFSYSLKERKEIVQSYLGVESYNKLRDTLRIIIRSGIKSPDLEKQFQAAGAMQELAFNLFDDAMMNELTKNFLDLPVIMQKDLIPSLAAVGDKRVEPLLDLYIKAHKELRKKFCGNDFDKGVYALKYISSNAALKMGKNINTPYMLQEAIKLRYSNRTEKEIVYFVIKKCALMGEKDFVKYMLTMKWALLVVEKRLGYRWTTDEKQKVDKQYNDFDIMIPFLRKLVVDKGEVRPLILLEKLGKIKGLRSEVEASKIDEFYKKNILILLDRYASKKERSE
jgi:hypothetical protein